jgi:hypothetical protein
LPITTICLKRMFLMHWKQHLTPQMQRISMLGLWEGGHHQ